MSRFRKTTIAAFVLLLVGLVYSEKAAAQFIAGSYGAGISPHWPWRDNSKGFTPSPEALYDERGRVTGSYNPANGRIQGHGFVPQSASHYGHRNGDVVFYVPMDVGLGGVTITPQNRQQRRYKWR